MHPVFSFIVITEFVYAVWIFSYHILCSFNNVQPLTQFPLCTISSRLTEDFFFTAWTDWICIWLPHLNVLILSHHLSPGPNKNQGIVRDPVNNKWDYHLFLLLPLCLDIVVMESAEPSPELFWSVETYKDFFFCIRVNKFDDSLSLFKHPGLYVTSFWRWVMDLDRTALVIITKGLADWFHIKFFQLSDYSWFTYISSTLVFYWAGIFLYFWKNSILPDSVLFCSHLPLVSSSVRSVFLCLVSVLVRLLCLLSCTAPLLMSKVSSLLLLNLKFCIPGLHLFVCCSV